ncbi:MAG: amidohydrolase family protein [Alphaproteobacteria bacterium]
MTHDLVIRGGTIYDGTGAPPITGDIAVDGDTVTTIGEVSGSGREEIDATDHIVTPGFVDIHTHFDAQIGWDPMLTPVSWHGVTTALMGNCGVTFAPVRADGRELLASMMETVEDIRKDAILTGLPWDWEHYGEYLDSVETMNPAINIAGLVGHCALRYYVMGERAVEEQATPEERREMAEIAGAAVKAGAVGFSTSRILLHHLPDGRHIPGTHAAHEELEEIAQAVGGAGGLMQNVTNLRGDFNGEMDLLAKQARAGGGRVLFSIGAGPTNEFGDGICDAVKAMRDDGLDINALTIPRGSGFVTGLQCSLLWRPAPWKRLAKMSFDDRLAAIRDEVLRRELIDSGKGEILQDYGGIWRMTGYDHIVWLGDAERPHYTGGQETSLQAMADAAGEHPVETFLRVSDESDGMALFTVRFFNQNLESLKRMLAQDFVLPGLGDAGAHVSQIMDAGWSTFVLSHWGRDTGFYSLTEAVRRISSAPARILGFSDRGTLTPGLRADINVIDLDRLAERMPRMVHDFPGGAKRFIQRADGYKATVCNGEISLRDDEHTGARPGRVLRH